MPLTDPPLAKISHPQEPTNINFSPNLLACLLGEIGRLQEQCATLQTQAIEARRDANYYKAMHAKAAERLLEKDGQIEALKSKVRELQHRLFGRKSERGAAEIGVEKSAPKRKRGQQPGAPGHGRKVHHDLPVVDVEVLPPEEQISCPHCNKPWVRFPEPETREEIDWQVRIVRIRTNRPKFRRPEECTCQDGRPNILCAPLPASLVSKGVLGINFIVQALLLKFLHTVPANQIGRMAASEGMTLSQGTLCGVLRQIAPLFVPLYEGIKPEIRNKCGWDGARCWPIGLQEARGVSAVIRRALMEALCGQEITPDRRKLFRISG